MPAPSTPPPTEQQPPLPDLRQDLTYHPGLRDGRGQSYWLIFDPVRNRYFQVDSDSYEILRNWRAMPMPSFAILVSSRLKRKVTEDELSDLLRFLYANNLTVEAISDDARSYAKQVAATKRTPFKRALHSYLFFKIPLVRPQKFLDFTYPLVAPLFSRTAFWIFFVSAVLGLYLVSRQWEQFTSTFLNFFSFEGALMYGAALIFVKSLHELGHAYTATRYGVRVNAMGVAFMVLFPILFTDVTDAWRLRKRKEQVAIAGAGIAVELAVAAISTLLWAFLPDGPERSLAFVLATTSWLMSLTINLNPFMRFDGYYLLSDSLGIANMQTRAFGVARWNLRKFLFGIDVPPPENFSLRGLRWMTFYGIGIWIYRLVLFLGIALIVYHMFFKVLGIFLFAVEIIWFIALPIARELMEWYKMRSEIIRRPRAWRTFAVVVVLFVFALVPLNNSVGVPAVMTAEREFRVFSPRPAQVIKLAAIDGADVKAGGELIRLATPDLTYQIEIVKQEIALNEARLKRIAGDQKDRADVAVIQNKLFAAKRKLAGYNIEKEKLVLRSPFDGRQRDVLFGLRQGDWVDGETSLMRVVDEARATVKGYAHEDDIWKLRVGDDAIFVPEDPLLATLDGEVLEIARTGSRNLEIKYLSSVYGGAVPSDKAEENVIEPRSGRYLVKVKMEKPAADRVVRGTLLIKGQPESFASAVWRRVLQVFVREAGI